MWYKLRKIFDSLTESERHVFIGALTVLIIASVLGAVGFFYNTTTIAPVQGGRFVEGIVGQPVTINPLIAQGNDTDQDLITIVYENILSLAENYKVSDDHKEWTIQLKPDLKWSDGQNLTSDDVVFTIAAIQDPDTHSPSAPLWQGVSVERLSEREVKLRLRTPYSFFIENLKDLRIVPEHIFGTIPSANLRLSDYNLEPVGSGAYQFLGYQKKKDGFIQEFDFETNPYYGGDAPLIQEFRIRFYQTFNDAIAAFNKKEIDSLGGLDHNEADRLKTTHQILAMDIPRYYAVFFNENAHPALRVELVREMLTAITNQQDVVAIALGGEGTIVKGPIHPLIEGFQNIEESVESLSRDDINEILDEEGWERNDLAIREKTIRGETVTLDFEVIVPQIPFLVDSAQQIKEQWAEIGVRLTPIVLAPQEISKNVIAARNYQMILFGNILKSSPDIFSFWHSSERFHPGLNLALYEDKNLDSLLESVRVDFDPQTRNETLGKIQEIIRDDAPAVFLYSPNYLYAVPKNLGGIGEGFLKTPSNRFDEVASWYRKTARIFK